MRKEPPSPTTSILKTCHQHRGAGRQQIAAGKGLDAAAAPVCVGGAHAASGNYSGCEGRSGLCRGKLLVCRAVWSFSGTNVPSFLLWLGYSLFSFLAATACLYISPEAEGSGIPEIKSILSGSTT